MLSAPDFEYVTRLLLENAAIRINTTQEYLVRSRLEPLAKQSGLPSLSALVEELRKQPYGELHRRVVEAMTTNETSFFRDVHPFETLKVAVIPEMLRRKTDRTFRVWSGACSTGQEPYSLAMMLTEMPALKDYRISILATDLARMTLEKAEQGIYTALDVGRGLPARALAQHFERQGTSFRVKPQLRALIEWRQLNLAGKWPSMVPFDLILMRNVLIYFSPTTTESILRNARNVLQNHGAIFLGTTENMLGLNTGLESVTHGKTIYYKRAGVRP
ncbi:MAG TPA: protein-glutamate O-methyltransferase CheR [Polyangiales bacterium]|nr:protein-glutamate O-methyltransferase CheR [Polyangiales bacterium]